MRLAEVLGCLSLATDIVDGFRMEKAMRTAVLAAGIAERAGVRPASREASYWAGLVRYLGCTGFAPEESSRYSARDDVALRSVLAKVDFGSVPVVVDAVRPASAQVDASYHSLAWLAMGDTSDMRPAQVTRAGLLAAAIATFAAACRDPTQITVEVTTDVKCSDLRGTTFTVGELSTLDERPLTTSTTQCDPALTRIGSMVIVPSGENDDTVALRVVVGLGIDPADCKPPAFGPGCIVARRALRFVPHRSLTLPIHMATACNGIACGATETCVQGDCRLATIPEPEACTVATGCGETELLAPAGDAGVVRDAASDVVAARPLCAPVPGNPCTSALPIGWSPLAFAARVASCPDGYTAVDLVTRAAPRLGACKCACQVSAADPPSCAKGTLVGTAGNTPTCDGAAVGGPINGAVCVVKPGNTVSYARYASLGLTRGTCTSSSVVDQGATSDPARACIPSAQCGEAVCSGAAPEGFASCIVHDGDVACPVGPFANRTLAGTRAEIACSGCPTCQNTATCSVPIVRAYNDGICTTEVTSVVVNGNCNLLTGAAGQPFGSIKYDVALTNPSCTPTSEPIATASLAAPRTICCL